MFAGLQGLCAIVRRAPLCVPMSISAIAGTIEWRLHIADAKKKAVQFVASALKIQALRSPASRCAHCIHPRATVTANLSTTGKEPLALPSHSLPSLFCCCPCTLHTCTSASWLSTQVECERCFQAHVLYIERVCRCMPALCMSAGASDKSGGRCPNVLRARQGRADSDWLPAHDLA